MVALPGAEEERLVAEEEVVGPARRGEEALRLGARRLPLVRLPLEQLRRAVPGPADLEDHEHGGQHDRGRRAAAGSRGAIPRPTRIAKNGRTKMRWRDSGDVEPPRRAARNAATGTPITQRASTRASLRTRHEADQREHEHDDENGPAPGAEVAGRLPQIRDDRPRAAELGATAADADVEAAREHEVGEPERHADDGHGRERDHRLPQALAVGGEHEHALGREDERAVGMRCDGEQDRDAPERPALPGAAIERAEQEHEREQREEEEEAVHPGVDAVEEEDPAAGDERRRDQRRRASGEPTAEERDQGQARRPRRPPRRAGGCRARGRDARRRRRRGSGAARLRARG